MMGDAVLRLLRRALDRGQAVEIEGLGAFRTDPGGGYEFLPESRLNVFSDPLAVGLLPGLKPLMKKLLLS